MAMNNVYANFGLSTGSNDGSSEANAWQSESDVMSATLSAGDHLHLTTAGGGALLRELGLFGAGEVNNYIDIGALQHQAAAGGNQGISQGLHTIDSGIVA